tara:strand:- start:149 stop:361 length:213 start_codon:yes stop_codon:yes gene_type:complete
MYSSFGGFKERSKERREKAKQESIEKERLEQEKLRLMKNKESEDNKKIYLIAGAVAVLGAVIIIIKTRKR